MSPSGGRAEIYGRVVSMLELGIGLAPALTVRQNIHVQGRLTGIPHRAIVAAEEEILDFSGLRDYADQPLRLVPGGGAVQLSFATMIGLGAEIVLADEVLAVGDAEFRAACEARVLGAGAAGHSVLFVSHDMAAIRRICSRVIWIDRGRIVRDGPTDEVVDAYTTELLAGRLRPASEVAGRKGAVACRLLDVRLLDAQRAPVGALQLTERGYVDCLFRAGAGVSAVVEITLMSRKMPVLKARSAPITTGVATTFSAGIVIPEDFLNEQGYQARVRVLATRLVDTAEYQVAGEERLDFTAMNPHPERSVWNDWPWGRAGLLSPRLAWTIQPAKQEHA
jgi:ABC-type sugar transport system ATPase subunit